MAGTKKTRLPEPRQALAIRPKLRSTTYAALARRTDVLLAKAEEAVEYVRDAYGDRLGEDGL